MGNRNSADPRRDGGFALLIVLWAVVLLGLLATQLAAAGRTEAQLAANLRDAAAAEAAADGAVDVAIFHLLGGGEPWPPAGRHRVQLGDAFVEVATENLAGRVNPNVASPGLLRALLQEVGVSPQRATALTDAIMDWRTPGARARPHGAKAPEYQAAGLGYGPPEVPFRDLDELGAVLGMTPELLALLRPHLTLWWNDEPDPAAAGPVVRAALRAVGGDEALRSGSRPGVLVVGVVAEAAGPHGGRFVRRAVVQVAPPGRSSWRVLDWGMAGP